MKNEKLCPRFVKEFAAYTIRGARNVETAKRNSYARRINHIVAHCAFGYITPSEAVRLIAEEAIY